MIVRDIPKTLSAIVLKMTAKRPQERYQSMNDVVHDLEEFLGVVEAGPFTPRQEHRDQLKEQVDQFNRGGWSVLRGQIIYAFLFACGLGALLTAITLHPMWAAFFVGMIALTALAYQIIIGVTNKTYIFIRFRQLVLNAGVLDWIQWSVVMGLLLMLLIALNWVGPWIISGVLGVLLGLGLAFSLDVMAQRQRQILLDQTRQMLKQFRLHGLDENAIQRFVCQESGPRWEEFFEQLFGYPAKIKARQQWRDRSRPKFGAWRDPLVRWIDRKQTARIAARQRNLLASIEADALRARGVDPNEIVRQAQETARRVMENVAKLQRSAAKTVAAPIIPTPAAAGAAPGSPANIMQIVRTVSAEFMNQAAAEAQAQPREVVEYHDDEQDQREHLSWFQRRFGSPFALIFGHQVRFVLAVLILIGFGVWWRQNKGLAALEQVQGIAQTHREIRAERVRGGQIDAQYVIESGRDALEHSGTTPLNIPHMPEVVNLALSGWNAALAGVILLVSAACRGKLMSFTVLLATLVALFGHWFVLPGIGSPQPWMSAAAAGIIAFLGIFFLRRTTSI